jgi:phosphoribosylformimino-5-aminoimidazole carboxamide ribotide isomerase
MVGGKLGTERIVSDDPVKLAVEWEQRGAKRLHLVDLDAVMGTGSNRDLLGSILASVKIPIQVGGGLRTRESLENLFSRGASRVVVGTRAIKDPDWLRSMALLFPEKIVLALDYKSSELLVEGWREKSNVKPETMIALANKLPLGSVLFTDVEVEGRLGGIGNIPQVLLRLCRHEKIASGGVSGLEDLQALRRAGFDHAIVGKALYAGLDFDEAEGAMA